MGGRKKRDDEWLMDRWLAGWTDGLTDGWTDGWTDEEVGGQMDGWADRWADGRMDGWMGAMPCPLRRPGLPYKGTLRNT